MDNFIQIYKIFHNARIFAISMNPSKPTHKVHATTMNYALSHRHENTRCVLFLIGLI